MKSDIGREGKWENAGIRGSIAGLKKYSLNQWVFQGITLADVILHKGASVGYITSAGKIETEYPEV